jgi:aryl-alcohol dehydrogenase-like predicted oxidoreductase
VTSDRTFVIGGRLTVPRMVLGTMFFGTTVPIDRARACLDRAYELGARFWDTANNYSSWVGGTGDESEACIGDWLAARGSSVRDGVVLATKLGARAAPGGTSLADALGLSRDVVRPQLINSLWRLRTDRVDVLYAHLDDVTTPFEETLGALSELVEEGLVGRIAASNLTAPRLRQALATPSLHRYQALQQRFSYLDPDPATDLGVQIVLDDEVTEICADAGVTLLGYSTLLAGAYTRDDRPLPDGYDTPPNRRALVTLAEEADRAGLDHGQTVLAWMVQRRRPVIPVIGASTPGQVDAAWQATATPLDPTALDRLDGARRQAAGER